MNDQVMAELLIFWLVSTPVFLVLATFWKSFVLVRLWGWFVVPFFQAKPLTIPLAFGLCFVVALVTGIRNGLWVDFSRLFQDEGALIADLLLQLFLLPAYILLMGWIVSRWVHKGHDQAVATGAP